MKERKAQAQAKEKVQLKQTICRKRQTHNMNTELNSRNKNSQRKYKNYQQIDTRVIKR